MPAISNKANSMGRFNSCCFIAFLVESLIACKITKKREKHKRKSGFSFVLPLFLVSKQESEKAVDDVVAH